jgi:hypothetical protein
MESFKGSPQGLPPNGMPAEDLVKRLLGYIEEWKYEESSSGEDINYCGSCHATFGHMQVLTHRPNCELEQLLKEANHFIRDWK